MFHYWFTFRVRSAQLVMSFILFFCIYVARLFHHSLVIPIISFSDVFVHRSIVLYRVEVFYAPRAVLTKAKQTYQMSCLLGVGNYSVDASREHKQNQTEICYTYATSVDVGQWVSNALKAEFLAVFYLSLFRIYFFLSSMVLARSFIVLCVCFTFLLASHMSFFTFCNCVKLCFYLH